MQYRSRLAKLATDPSPPSLKTPLANAHPPIIQFEPIHCFCTTNFPKPFWDCKTRREKDREADDKERAEDRLKDDTTDLKIHLHKLEKAYEQQKEHLKTWVEKQLEKINTAPEEMMISLCAEGGCSGGCSQVEEINLSSYKF